MTDWRDIDSNLDSADENLVIRTLEDIVLDDTKLDEDATKHILPKCIAKLQHHDIRIRSNAVAVIAKEMREDNTALVYVVEELGKGLASPNLLDIKQGTNMGETYTLLHKDLCYIIEYLQQRFPGKLMPSFKPIAQYLVVAVGSKVVDVSKAACQYWGNLQTPLPVPSKYMPNWYAVVSPKLQKLIPYLINAAQYHPDHLTLLESKKSETTRQTASKEEEDYGRKRNYASLGLQSVCLIFQQEAIPVFKMNLLSKFKSDNWLHVEVATLALAAITQALGTPKEMQDAYGEIVNKIIENFKHPNPIVRTISLFAMQNFATAKLKGVKNPFSKTLRAALQAVKDESIEVQDMGLRCLATLLGEAESDLQPHAKKILEALITIDASIKGNSRYTYYECVAHCFGRLGENMESVSAEPLMIPLIKEWEQITWNDLQNSSTENFGTLSECFCVVAMFARDKFSVHNRTIFDKVVPFLNNVAESANGHSLDGEPTTSLMTAVLDVTNAIFQGQSSNIASLAKTYNLDKCVLKILKNEQFAEPVHQSSIATFGYISKHYFEGIKDHAADTLPIIDKMLKSKSEASLKNAAWALAQFTRNVEDKNDTLFLMMNQLGEIFLNTAGDAVTVINAALAISYIGVKWPDKTKGFFVKDEIFTHLFILANTPFDLDEEKVDLFQNILTIYSDCIGKVKPELWLHFCVAAANCDVTDQKLDEQIKQLLKDVRGHVGNKTWNKINGQIGKQASINLRKKYNLY